MSIPKRIREFWQEMENRGIGVLGVQDYLDKPFELTLLIGDPSDLCLVPKWWRDYRITVTLIENGDE